MHDAGYRMYMYTRCARLARGSVFGPQRRFGSGAGYQVPAFGKTRTRGMHPIIYSQGQYGFPV